MTITPTCVIKSLPSRAGSLSLLAALCTPKCPDQSHGHLGRLVRLPVGARDDDRVAVRVFDPDLAMAWTIALAFRRVTVRCPHDRRVELLGARYDFVEIGHFAEPEQNSIPNVEIWADKESMVVFNIAMMELKDERLAREQPFVVWTAMITAQAKEL